MTPPRAFEINPLIGDDKMSVIEEIAAERRRQIEAEGWSIEHDDSHMDGDMANAAACYAMHPNTREIAISQISLRAWVWPTEWVGWWKPKDRRRDLIRAAALIVAEIERLDRASP